MIPYIWPYYCAIVFDLFLRFFWSYTLIPQRDQQDFSDIGVIISPISAIAEILRRTMWSVLRLENEHLNNTAGYRDVLHIPLHFDPPPKAKVVVRKDKPTFHRKCLIKWAEIVAFFLIVSTIILVAVFSAK